MALTLWIEGMRARGRTRGEGEGSRLCRALTEGEVVTEAMLE